MRGLKSTKLKTEENRSGHFKRLLAVLGGMLLHVVSWMLFVSALLGGLAGYIDPEVWAAPSLLCLLLPYLWLGTLVVGLLWWFVAKSKLFAIGAGVVLLACLPAIFTLSPVSLPGEPEAGERTFKVFTFNALYCGDVENPDADYSRSLSHIIHSGADVVCLQEQYNLDNTVSIGKATREQVDSVTSIYPYQVNNTKLDIMLLSKYPVRVKHVAYPEQMNFFMYQSYEIDIKGLPLTILNVHMPSYTLSEGEREILDKINNGSFVESFMELRGSILNKMSVAFAIRARAAQSIVNYVRKTKGPLIICGDFNDVPGSWAYRKIRSTGLRDAYCDAGFGPMVTYNLHHMYFHIDQILYRGPIRAIEVSRGNMRSSDHYPVMARFAIEAPVEN